MQQRHEADVAHALEVAQDPLAVERDSLEPRVEAERDQPELVGGAVDLGERGRAVARLHDPARYGESVGGRVAVRRDVVVHAPRRGDAVGAQVTVARDHQCLPDTAFVHDPDPVGELDARELRALLRIARELAAQRVEGATHVVVHVEDVVRGVHGASSGQSASAVPPRTAARSTAVRPAHARWASVTSCAYGRSWV